MLLRQLQIPEAFSEILYLMNNNWFSVFLFQNLGEIPNLDGIEDDEELSEEMSTRALGYKAFRFVHFF